MTLHETFSAELLWHDVISLECETKHRNLALVKERKKNVTSRDWEGHGPWVKVVSINKKIVNWNHALGITNNQKVSGSVICYFQPKMIFFIVLFSFFGYILTVNTSSHVPVLNFEEKNCVIQNAIITWTDIFLEHVMCTLFFPSLLLVIS